MSPDDRDDRKQRKPSNRRRNYSDDYSSGSASDEARRSYGWVQQVHTLFIKVQEHVQQ